MFLLDWDLTFIFTFLGVGVTVVGHQNPFFFWNMGLPLWLVQTYNWTLWMECDWLWHKQLLPHEHNEKLLPWVFSTFLPILMIWPQPRRWGSTLGDGRATRQKEPESLSNFMEQGCLHSLDYSLENMKKNTLPFSISCCFGVSISFTFLCNTVIMEEYEAGNL